MESTYRIRGGEIQHTGVIPFLKSLRQRLSAVLKTVLEEVVQRFTSLFGNKEIEDIIVLKNNKGTEDNRVRKLDYSIQLSKLFYERFINDEDITLFSPHEVPELYEPKSMNLMNFIKRQKEKQQVLVKKSVGTNTHV